MKVDEKERMMVINAELLTDGIITVNTTEQAWERARADKLNKGGDAARAALTMMRIKKRLAKPL